MAADKSAHTFLFADLAGFTAMTEAMGDESAAELAERFCDQVEGLAPEFGSVAIKRIGDAVMLRSDHAEQAVRLGIRIAHEIGDSHYLPTVRVGMHTGEAVERAGDWFGATVNLAGRVSAEASGSEVLLTEATRKHAGALEGIEFRDRGRRQLRNIADPVSLYLAAPEGERSGAGLPIDPVCRMAVDPQHSAGSLNHEGTTYHFCSLECVGRFAAHPDRYAGNA
jgi:class 3 adenylate cyclase/YHS domain-containing protein